ncbi:MAG: hypothetical protein ACOCQ4_00360 [bacterium]
MSKEKLKDLYINWKGLEFLHSIKCVLKFVIIILSIIFVFISLKIQSDFILGISLILLFLQILSENNKEYFLKYKAIYEKIQKGNNINAYKDWINFLEKTKGLNSFYKWVFKKIFNRSFEQKQNELKKKKKK